ncbi:MAG: lysylphosphatidylglycerol synthase transmembrane domain-containing protein [Candidatus Omnitrophota bacterium]|nr:lysylphosphatidylglycerol synthase transmembrane domain-containing protein [Candidatus Omnitrophota bacterium]
MKTKIISFLRVFVSIALIFILLYIMRDKYGEILDVLKGTDPKLFSIAVGMFIAAISLGSYRFKLIIEAQGDMSIKFKEAFSLTFIGYFFNNFLPTSVGGDVVKAYYLSRKFSRKMESYTSVFVDRVIGLFTMIFMASLALLFVQNHIIDNTVRSMIYAITAVSVLAIIFMTNKKFAKNFSVLLRLFKPIEGKLRKAYDSVHKYKYHMKLIWQSLVISIISQILFFASIGILAFAIGSSLPAMDILLRMPIISAMSLLPSINGLGLREGSTVVLFGPIIGKENSFAVSVLWLLILLIMSLVGGIIYAFSPQFKFRLQEISRQNQGEHYAQNTGHTRPKSKPSR